MFQELKTEFFLVVSRNLVSQLQSLLHFYFYPYLNLSLAQIEDFPFHPFLSSVVRCMQPLNGFLRFSAMQFHLIHCVHFIAFTSGTHVYIAALTLVYQPPFIYILDCWVAFCMHAKASRSHFFSFYLFHFFLISYIVFWFVWPRQEL